MIHLEIPESIRRKAKTIASDLEKKYSGNSSSIMSGQGHYYAKLGEILIAQHFHWHHADTFDYDILAKDKRDGSEYRVEVKVKKRTVRPRANYLATVAGYNYQQKCDYYMFASTIEDRELYIIGMLPKDEFLFYATYHKKGVTDHESPPGLNWTFRADCFNLPYAFLRPVGKMELF